MQISSKRAYFFDELRGLSIILMIIYHAAFDLVYIFGIRFDLLDTPLVMFLRNLFAALFIFISGISTNYSRSNIKRGMKYLVFGFAVSIITFLFAKQALVSFGILHLIGVAVLLSVILKNPLSKIPAKWGAIIFFVLFILSFRVQTGTFGLWNLINFKLPQMLYENGFMFILGFPSKSFFSADYFPLLPWIFIFLCGLLFGRYVKENKLPEFFYKKHIPFLDFVGTHTLLIYILHQPIIIGIMYLIFAVI